MKFRLILTILSFLALIVGVFIVKTYLEDSYVTSLSKVRQVVIMKNNWKYDIEQFRQKLSEINENLSSTRAKLSTFGQGPDAAEVKALAKLKSEMYAMNKDWIGELLRDSGKARDYLKLGGHLTDDENVFYSVLAGSPVFDKAIYSKLKTILINQK